MDEKKKEEYNIVKRIYSDVEYDIEFSEKPDFIINKKGEKDKFGVEVTELFYSQSSARLKKIPYYSLKLLKEGIPRKDQGILGEHELYIKDGDEWVYLGKKIDQSFKNYDDYINAIANTIIIKTKKAKSYKRLKYYELIIEDQEKFLFFKQIRDIEYLEKSKIIQDAIDKSPFKRIYLFTIINKRKVLSIMGDIYSGPLYKNYEEIEKHREYMEELFKKNNKNWKNIYVKY